MSTQTAAESRDTEKERLHRQIKYFLHRWAPVNDDREFESDLYMLVSAIHTDAARGYQKLIEQALVVVPHVLRTDK